MNNQKTFEYKAEMKQLLNIIVHSLYTHPEIFLRELISNASDALNKLRVRRITDKNILDPEEELAIHIDIDEKNHTFSIEDTGIGMSKDDLINNIGTIAHSGTLEFLKNLNQDKANLNEKLIGQFGVGFYSVFMVADKVTIETRSADTDSLGYRWESTGEGTFTIEEIDKKTRGTKIYFTFKETAHEFSQEYKIKNIITKYSNFINFPLYLKKQRMNTIEALWYKKPQDLKEPELNDFYKFISNDFENPLGYLTLDMEGAVNIKAIIFIPATAPFDLLQKDLQKSLHLYSNKVLIQNDCLNLLPEYLRFLRGVVDTTDLPLNVSRELTQNSPVMEKIRSIIIKKVLSFFQDWAVNKPEIYKKFYLNFGRLLKTGINSDFSNRDKIIELLRFESTYTKNDELTSLKDYLLRMKSHQKEIYYLSGERKELIRSNPNLEYFKKNDIEVLFLTDPVDIFIVPSIGQYEKKDIKSITKGDIDILPKNIIDQANDKLYQSLIKEFKDTLADKVEDIIISKRLVDSPATLVTNKDGMDSQMEKILSIMDKNYTKSKRVMEINTNHPLIKNLGQLYLANSNNPLIKKCILQIYEGTLFLEGNLEVSADFVKRMIELMEQATK